MPQKRQYKKFRKARRTGHTNLAEIIVRKVLDKLQSQGVIRGFLWNRHNDRLDEEGIDFLIFLNNDTALPLQVTTWSKFRERNSEKYFHHFKIHKLVRHIIFVKTHFYPSVAVYDPVEQKIKSMIKRVLGPR